LPLCTQQLESFKPQEVSSTALAVAKAFGCGDEFDRGTLPATAVLALPVQVLTFFAAVGPWAVIRLREFSAQSLANTVSAYALLRLNGADLLFDAVANEVMRRFEGLEPTALLHLLKGFAAAHPGAGHDMLRTLAVAVSRHTSSYRPQEMQTLSRICSGLLGMRLRARELSSDELRQCLRCLGMGLPVEGELANLISDGTLEAPDTPTRRAFPLSHVATAGEKPATPGLQASPFAYMQDQNQLFIGLPVGAGSWGEPHVDGMMTEIPTSPLPRGSKKNRIRVRGNVSKIPHRGREDSESAGQCMMLCTIDESTRMMTTQMAFGGQVALLPCLQVGAPPLVPFSEGNSLKLAPAEDVLPSEISSLDTNSGDSEDYELQQPGRCREVKRFLQAGDAPWRCSIKNSFLHVEFSDGSDDSDSSHGGSSVRSSSVPSRIDHHEIREDTFDSFKDWGRRCQGIAMPVTRGVARPAAKSMEKLFLSAVR